jgi:predicted component of type VI protein secretion system
MYSLRLFHQDQPFTPIQARELSEGMALSLGRDAAADWPVDDPSCKLSRRHCVFAVVENRLFLQDVSTNGVFVGDERRRPAQGQLTEIGPGENITLGQFLIVPERLAVPPVAHTPAPAPAVADRADPGPETVKPKLGDAALLDAFCEGAGLNVSTFSDADAIEVMRRVGGVYRQMVAGLSALMNERTIAKTEYNLERTTVGVEGNNPFRWAPADRVAIDLLRPDREGFLPGPAAVQRSFSDVNMHLNCTVAAAYGAASAVLAALAPDAMLEKAEGRATFLKSRTVEAWDCFVDAHEAASQGFRASYEARLRTAKRQAS